MDRLPLESQKVSILGFVGHIIYHNYSTLHYNENAALDNTYTNGCNCAPMKLHLQKWAVDRIWLSGRV